MGFRAFTIVEKGATMAHLIKNKKKLLNRIRRIQGQANAIERLLNEDHHDCANMLHTLAACRGAINSLMGLVIEGHIDSHLLDPSKKPTVEQKEAAQELIDVFNSYLK